MGNISVKRIKTDEKKLFLYWLVFLKPYHGLRQKEMETVAVFLYYRHKLESEVLNKELIDKLLFSSDVRKNIMNELGMKSSYAFNNMLTSLRKRGVLSKDNIILPSLIPNFIAGSDNFKLIFNFEVNDVKQS